MLSQGTTGVLQAAAGRLQSPVFAGLQREQTAAKSEETKEKEG